MSFGVRLAQARKMRGLTQTELGKGLGTDGADASKAVVYGWEKDQHFPRVDQLRLICEKLGVSAQHLVFGTEAATPLSPEVAEVASAINALPPRWKAWTLVNVREVLSVATHAAGATAKAVSEHAPSVDDDQDQQGNRRLSR